MGRRDDAVCLNNSTDFISPEQTPEYLAAGLPVVSSAITDVVRPYGELGLVGIFSGADDLVRSAERAIAEDKVERLRKVDIFLAERSWERTFRAMNQLLNSLAHKPQRASARRAPRSVRYAM